MPSPSTPRAPVARETCSVVEACSRLGCSRNTFDFHSLPELRRRKGAFKRGGCGPWLIRLAVLAQLIEEDATRWAQTTGGTP